VEILVVESQSQGLTHDVVFDGEAAVLFTRRWGKAKIQPSHEVSNDEVFMGSLRGSMWWERDGGVCAAHVGERRRRHGGCEGRD
jgi:hypothetical protein